MYAVGMLGSYLTQGVYAIAGPFQPFGCAVDIIVVQQEDGTFKSSPWYVKFGDFQGGIKGIEKTVSIRVNDIPAHFHMFLDNKGEACFEKEMELDEGEGDSFVCCETSGAAEMKQSDGQTRQELDSSNNGKIAIFMDITPNNDMLTDLNTSPDYAEISLGREEGSMTDKATVIERDNDRTSLGSDVFTSLEFQSPAMTTDGEMIAAVVETMPTCSIERSGSNSLSSSSGASFSLGGDRKVIALDDCRGIFDNSETLKQESFNVQPCLGVENVPSTETSCKKDKFSESPGCNDANEAVNEEDKFIKGEDASKLERSISAESTIRSTKEEVDNQTSSMGSPPSRWSVWPLSFRSSRDSSPTPSFKKEDSSTRKSSLSDEILPKNGYYKWPQKSKVRTYVPTSAQLASLKLRDGPNKVTFVFSKVAGKQTEVDARIYLWKWSTRIVVSDVDGTITKSDVLGQVMPLVGRDWSQSGVTRLFSAIKDNEYEVLFLSARAISQAYLTRQFLLNLKQDGEALPEGPVFISPDGLFPSIYREVIRRTPHEFKISCLEGIRDLFPRDINPFYAGFGNRNTDEISYLKAGIPKGKIFIINPKGEIMVNHLVETRTYTTLHALVDEMFPPVSSFEQEDFNSWNFWKVPLPDVELELIAKSAKSYKITRSLKK